MSSQLPLGSDNTRRIVFVLIHYTSVNNNFTRYLKMLSVCRNFHCWAQMCSFPLQNSELPANTVVALPQHLYLYLRSYQCQLSSLKCIGSEDKKIKRWRLGDKVIILFNYYFSLQKYVFYFKCLFKTEHRKMLDFYIKKNIADLDWKNILLFRNRSFELMFAFWKRYVLVLGTLYHMQSNWVCKRRNIYNQSLINDVGLQCLS